MSSFFRPGFINNNSIPIIHEDDDQFIQGGLPGEHYHLSAAAHAALVEILTSKLSAAEPMTSLTGEIMLAKSGDIIVQGVKLPITEAP